jgi:hypothetical protein
MRTYHLAALLQSRFPGQQKSLCSEIIFTPQEKKIPGMCDLPTKLLKIRVNAQTDAEQVLDKKGYAAGR